MEMVKVDVQKLQLLNDRIAQTIDALNQVRLSVHGIQHSSQQQTPWTTNPYNIYSQFPYGVQPPSYGSPFTPSFGQLSPFAQFTPFTPYGAGLQHTTGYPPTPYPTNFTPYVTPVQPQSFARTPWTNGLSHSTGWEPRVTWMG
jgi:hypothetical protein